MSVDRTANLDAVNEAIMLGPTRLKLPGNSMSMPDLVSHMTSLTRVFDQELNRGEGGYVWAGDQPDHYFHAMGYMLSRIEELRLVRLAYRQNQGKRFRTK